MTVKKILVGCRNLVLVVLFSLAAFELVLRLVAGFLPMTAQNVLLSKFYLDPDGICYHDPRHHIDNFKPNYFEPNVFFNGHRWRHQTNGQGIRADRDLPAADIVALGDSLIYGYGMNNGDTICDFIEKETGMTVANLGRIGDCPYEQYIRLRDLGLFFHPKVVLFFINSFQDEYDLMGHQLTPESVRTLLEEPIPDYSKGIAASTYTQTYAPDRHEALKRKIYALISVHFWKRSHDLAQALLAQRFKPKTMTAAEIATQYKEKSQPLGEYVEQILLRAQELCRQEGAMLIVVSHPLVGNTSVLDGQVNEMCLRDKIPHFHLGETDLFQKNYPELFLKNYDHYSLFGNKYAAHKIAEYLRDTAVPEPHPASP